MYNKIAEGGRICMVNRKTRGYSAVQVILYVAAIAGGTHQF